MIGMICFSPWCLGDERSVCLYQGYSFLWFSIGATGKTHNFGRGDDLEVPGPLGMSEGYWPPSVTHGSSRAFGRK